MNAVVLQHRSRPSRAMPGFTGFLQGMHCDDRLMHLAVGIDGVIRIVDPGGSEDRET